MTATAALLPDGRRLHLQHGPIDLIIGAEGERDLAFAAAITRFDSILNELMQEMPLLRRAVRSDTPAPQGQIAYQMMKAVRPFAQENYVTAMAAVAGSVADEVLLTMRKAAKLSRAYVNNGGDIALHLEAGAEFKMAMVGHDGRRLGEVCIKSTDPTRGIATSGRHGRSLSLGIADSVTVLARTAAQADVAATLIANRVDLPDHPAIRRQPASFVDDNSDLGHIPVVTHCGPLSDQDVAQALRAGLSFANTCQQRALTVASALFLQNQNQATTLHGFQNTQRMRHYA